MNTQFKSSLRITAFVATGLLAALALGCEGPGADRPAAEVGGALGTAAGSAAAATAAAGSTERLAINPTTSKIGFQAAKISLKHDGGFNAFTGTIDLVSDKPETSRIALDIDASSVFSDNEKLTGHLKSPDFFDVATHPKATFVSTSLAPPAAPGGEWTITGDLTLRGTTKSIKFPAVVTIDATEVRATSEFRINRKDFGIIYPGAPDDLINDDVLIKLDVRAPRGAAGKGS